MMRRAAVGVLAIALMGAVSACVPSDVQDPYQRTLAGATLGALFGASVGSIVAIDSGIGAVIGTGAGGLVGAAAGLATVEPKPTYAPIQAPTAQIIPGFYDTWPPGYYPPTLGSEVAPPPAQL
jgi:hypothetical protein